MNTRLTRSFDGAPESPHHRAINDWLYQVSVEFGIKLPIRGTDWSPGTFQRSLADHCLEKVKFLYWSNRPALQAIIIELKQLPVASRTTAELHAILQKKSKDRVSHKNTTSGPTLRSSVSFPPPSSPVTPLLQKLQQSRDHDFVERPSTPTEEDLSDEYGTPPQSPSSSHPEKVRSPRKRPSESSGMHSEPSPKIPRPASNRSSRGSSRISRPQVPPSPVASVKASFASSFQAHIESFRTSQQTRSFETEMTEPDYIAPEDSAFSITSSERRDIMGPPSRISKSETNSSALYGIEPDIEEEMVLHDPKKATKPGPERQIDLGLHPSRSLSSKVVDYRVKNLPSDGFCFAGSSVASNLPFYLKFECARVAISLDLPFEQCIAAVPDYPNYDSFWDAMHKLPRHGKQRLIPTSQNAWEIAYKRERYLSLSGRLEYNTLKSKGKSTLFKLALNPPFLDKDCRFQRKLGADRFLFLSLPVLEEREADTTQQRRFLLDWLDTDVSWLDRSWSAIHLEPSKKKNRDGKLDSSYRVVFFATSGVDIEPVSLKTFLGWFMSLDHPRNLSLPSCKAFSRLDLGFSKTTPSYHFTYAQVREVSDIMSDWQPEPTEFNDPALDWLHLIDGSAACVMNDGCSRISLAASREVWKSLRQVGEPPSIFQARINGAKGVWITSSDAQSATPDDHEIWIEITPQQRKFFPHVADTDARGRSFDPLRWSFEIVRWSRRLSQSSLHLSFIPILVDRGVPQDTFLGYIKELLDEERKVILEALGEPLLSRAWVEKAFSSNSYSDNWLGGLPFAAQGKAIMLLDHGFHPAENRFLGQETDKLLWWHFSSVIQNCRVSLPRSTMVMGIADPTKTLKPGEVHLMFSETFETEGQNYTYLHSLNVLVARHPALRASDIQKVKAVFRPRLAHLKDVIVFPSTGFVPLASKLQGGDYDGDTFWVCWDQNIVESFKNAPAPTSDTLKPPESFGIEVDRRKLSEILHDGVGGNNIRRFLRHAFEFRLRPDLLGLVTTYHERLTYRINSLRNPNVELFADLHDYLIDSAKNGYIFDKEQFHAWKKDLVPKAGLPEPAYKRDIGERDKLERSNMHAHERNLGSRQSPSKVTPPAPMNPNSVLDTIHFNIIIPHVDETISLTHSNFRLKDVEQVDECLVEEYFKARGKIDAAIHGELGRLELAYEQILRVWRISGPFADRVEDAYGAYCALQPTNQDHMLIDDWANNRVGLGPTRWELIKASALIKKYPRHHNFVWYIAGEQLCYLKAQSFHRPCFIVRDIAQNMKMKKYKTLAEELNQIKNQMADNEDSGPTNVSDPDTEFYSVPEF